ncbi:MAG: PEP-CTERM sorting domain-containing protein [Gammaproteobacteria bacterium]|nr:PEP-CTERM sorting domain-containing protein [Gammaproteobacteria bacterium]
MKAIKLMTALATLGIMPLSLHAMSMAYDFTGGPAIMTARSFTEGGVTLDVTAQTEFGDDIFVSQNMNAGIGACLTLTDCGAGMADTPQLDSVGPDEILSFSVSGGSLILDGFLFGAYNVTNLDRDNFELVVDGVSITNGAFNPGANPWSVFADFGTLVVNSSFSIRALEVNGVKSSFRITELYATKLAEPGTLGMLLFGLAAIGLIRRRKSH